MLQLEALNDCLVQQLDLGRLRGLPCDCDNDVSAPTPESRQTQCARKVEALETLVAELQDTNRHLVETLTELEYEARNRVRLMEQVLERTAHSAKAYMVELSEYEQTTRTALKDKLKYLAVIKKLGDQVSRLERDKADAQDHCGNLAHDITSLVRLIGHARNTGRWDIGNIDFCEVTCEQVFGSIDKLDSWPGDLDCLDNPAFDAESPIRDLRNATFKSLSIPERAPSVFSQSSVHTMGASSGGHVTRRDADLCRLQVELRHAHKQLTAVQSELSHRDRMIADLQVQIVDQNHQISLKDSECFVHHHRNHHLKQLEQTNGGGDGHLLATTTTTTTTTSASSPNDGSELAEYHSSAFTAFQQPQTKGEVSSQHNHLPLSTATSDSGLDRLTGVPQRRLHELVSQLTGDCQRLNQQLAERDAELREASARNARLQRDMGDVERVWQELDACKEDHEVVLAKLDSKRQMVRELRAALRQRDEAKQLRTASVAAQTETDQPCSAELERLTLLEERHRLKAAGLEMVVGQLQDRLTEAATRELALVERSERQLNDHASAVEVASVPDVNSEQLAVWQETVSGLRQELSVILDVVDHKNREIDNQKLTIRNLQEAVVLMKRVGPAAAAVAATSVNGGPDQAPAQTLVTNGTDKTTALSKLSKSRDILHI